jgi:hypothetical protein
VGFGSPLFLTGFPGTKQGAPHFLLIGQIFGQKFFPIRPILDQSSLQFQQYGFG